MGKKYMTEKLHVATRKLLMPTRTGIFCRSNDGANTGSGAMNSSTTRKSTAKTLATTTDAMTLESDHCVACELVECAMTKFKAYR